MRDYYSFNEDFISIGRCEDLLGDPYFYVISKDQYGQYVSFLKSFGMVISFLENFYDRGEFDEKKESKSEKR